MKPLDPDRPCLTLPEQLSDQTLAQLLELLYRLAEGIESRYTARLCRYDRRQARRQRPAPGPCPPLDPLNEYTDRPI